MLPPWTDWFDVEEIEKLLPDPQIRQAFVSELPRVPIQMFEETLPESRGWPNAVCCYLRLSPAYVEDSVRAVSAACRIAVFDGNHLSIVTDPDGVTAAMLDLAGPIRG